MATNEKILVANEEVQIISNYMSIWANTWDGVPDDIEAIKYEDLSVSIDGTSAMALSTIQSTVKTKKYITGGYEAEYQFKLIYRLMPAGSTEKRLAADAALNAFGDWATNNLPDLGEGVRAVKIEPQSQSSLFARYEDGYEDYQILMKLTYEVVYPLSFTDTE